jgi:hypothetical protein
LLSPAKGFFDEHNSYMIHPAIQILAESALILLLPSSLKYSGGIL